MSRRVLLAGGLPERRAGLAASIDAVFDVDVVSVAGPLEALRKLPNAEFGLVVVLQPSVDGEAPGLDLVRFVTSHARHGRTPVVLLGATDAEMQAARSMGAHALPATISDADVRALVQDLLGLG